MISQLIAWFYISFLLLGIGLLGKNIVQIISGDNKSMKNSGPIHLIFIGYLILHTLLGYISIFAPIGSVVHVVTAFLSIGIIFLNQRSLREMALGIRKEFRGQPLYIVIPPLLFLLVIFSYSLYPLNHYDTGLYYLQNMQWIENFPVVKGLANLHGRFGFNSHFLIDSSFFSLGFLNVKSGDQIIKFYSLNSLMYCLLTIKIIFNMGRYFRLEKWYYFTVNLLVLYFSFRIVSELLSNPSPDLITVTLISYLVIYILDREGIQSGITLEVFIITSLLVFTIVTIKISNAFIPLLCLFYLLKFKGEGLVYLAVISIVVMAPFLIRNVFLTGYIVYPLHSLDLFHFDWEVPNSLVKSEYGWIKSWAILPGGKRTDVLSMLISDWFIIWFKSQGFIQILLALLPLSIGSLFISRNVSKSHKFLVVVFLISLVYWFISAPDPRFVWGILICLGSITIASYISLINKTSIIKWIFGLSLLYISFFETRKPFKMISDSWKYHRFYPSQAASIEITIHKLEGFEIKVPIKGDRCFDTEIPCSTPHFNKKISMRGETFRDGFKHLK